MNEVDEKNHSLYLKLIDYRRSIGTTQWAVFSIFATMSHATFAISFNTSLAPHGRWIRVYGLCSFFLGLALYHRYRDLNKSVEKHMRELEEQLGISFLRHMQEHFHEKKRWFNRSTAEILILFTFLYILIVVLSLFIR